MNSRDKLIALAVLAAAQLTGCASGGQSDIRWTPDRFLMSKFVVTAPRDYLDHYACTDGRPLMCRCASLLARTCDCSC
jgi:hypothetical protein